MIRLVTFDNEPGQVPETTLEINDVPAAVRERNRAETEAYQRNRAWFEANHDRLRPLAMNKYIAVAHQQGHIAETKEEAWAWIKSNHPDDPGAFVQAVVPFRGPIVDAHRG